MHDGVPIAALATTKVQSAIGTVIAVTTDWRGGFVDLRRLLPGMVASVTPLPVIGVPLSAALGGLDALLSTVQMPPGVPVACVGIDNARNAAHLALRILRPAASRPS